ncbi:MAG: hypothetical protein HC874_15740 [Richelia sp. SL_2_1]|nr:hypothetical protein [Richelia sp. SM1_7_0]NJO28827.1 hypothetical protein [Richelia sp. SL_2_1]
MALNIICTKANQTLFMSAVLPTSQKNILLQIPEKPLRSQFFYYSLSQR